MFYTMGDYDNNNIPSTCVSFCLDNGVVFDLAYFHKYQTGKSLQGLYPLIYRALSRYIKVGKLVIIHIDYDDYAVDALLYLVANEKNAKQYDELRKKKLCVEQRVKLSQILQDLEKKSIGMPTSMKIDLFKRVAMMFTNHAYPRIHRGLAIMDTFDQDGVVAELSDGEIKVVFPFASDERGRVDDSLRVEWGNVEIE